MQALVAHPAGVDRAKVTKRTAYGVIGGLALVFAILEAAKHGGATIAATAFFVAAPDLSMLVGARDPKPKGYLSPGAVPVYNAVHRLGWPIALLAVFTVVQAPAGFGAGLAWLAHIAIDRSVGYGPRSADGSIAT